MENNITREDLDHLIAFLQSAPILTQSSQVRQFEKAWSHWLGVSHSVFVNSGSSANILALAALRQLSGEGGEVIVPPLGWVSDINAVLFNGFTPVFADINPRTLAMDEAQILAKITSRTKAVLLIHIQGFNGLTQRLLHELDRRGIMLIEDVCESHGAEFNGRKLGGYGAMSCFSFYYAHHMSSIEGGMVCTNDHETYEIIRMLRSHGMVREADDEGIKQRYAHDHPDLSPHFIFAYPGYNMRNTEIGAVLANAQLSRLDANNHQRRLNFALFLENLDPGKYRTDFDLEGSCNYAFNLILKHPDTSLRKRVESALTASHVEFRRGSSGGGNQLRQPYLSLMLPKDEHKRYPQTEHLHFFGYYIGNYPDLSRTKILTLCELLNAL